MEGDVVAVNSKKSLPDNYLNALKKNKQSLIKISRYANRDFNPEPPGYKDLIT
jgi:hypothetical protein